MLAAPPPAARHPQEYLLLRANGGLVEPDYDEITQRNIGLLTPEEQARLRSLVVAVAGCGGVGAPAAHFLARLGVGELRLADPEEFEPSNINRQFAAYLDTIGVNKAEAVARELRRINPELAVRTWAEGVGEDSIGPLLDGADAVVDALDFWSLDIELLLHREAARRGPVDLHQPGSGGDHDGDVVRPLASRLSTTWSPTPVVPSMAKAIASFMPVLPKAATPELLARAIAGEQPSVPLDVLASSFEATFLVNELLRVTVRGLPPHVVAPDLVVFDQDELMLRSWDGRRAALALLAAAAGLNFTRRSRRYDALVGDDRHPPMWEAGALRIVRVTDQRELVKLYGFRYRVFVEELGWMARKDRGAHVLVDEFDRDAAEYAAYERASGQIVGSVRAVADGPLGLPLERCRVLDGYRDDKRLVELSRLAVAPRFRGTMLAATAHEGRLPVGGPSRRDAPRARHVYRSRRGHRPAVHEARLRAAHAPVPRPRLPVEAVGRHAGPRHRGREARLAQSASEPAAVLHRRTTSASTTMERSCTSCGRCRHVVIVVPWSLPDELAGLAGLGALASAAPPTSELAELAGRERARRVEPLTELAAQPPQLPHLLLPFDALGDDLQLRASRRW